ncbi:MAG: cytochrome b N-terminal domain-containing protein [Gammaproteobacteria bacterium]|nr:cytochrome b N-terminal domain-containing protein [Gammaproteobacteria bacterium]
MRLAPQSLLRACFMRVEALFNRAFGDQLNPFYQLGALAFFLFWVVVGSGLYLYAFFDTSVEGAYRSVDALTRQQWFAGGVLRSVHRYASDAMVVTMLIHLLRYWAFDRLRGFRWFSWVTGVVLLWLVFAAGVNGYMLPWDKLAQFVTQASFEWLDWLPGFGGTLIRNFIYDRSVSNRLFSLLVFIHIGVPLLVLLLMWVHVQRVPKARTQPPRVIVLSVLAMLVLLALARPVVSHEAAHLASAPVLLDFDWFLLALYPLVYVWSPAEVWALVLGVSVLLLLAPWLPPRRANAASEHNVVMHPGAVSVSTRVGETLLEAGLRAGLTLPYECRAGGCGVCVCTVLNGRVEHGNYQPSALDGAMRARGQALMCCATALDDVEIEIDVETLSAPTLAPQRHQATLSGIETLAPDVRRLWLTVEGGERIAFSAGQYINIVLDDGATRSYSFANAPHDNGRIELHVRRVAGGRFSELAFERLRVGDTLRFEGPFGRFTLHEGSAPILFIAGATGFAPIKSIVEDAFHRAIERPMFLYWGVRARADLYMATLAEQWAAEHPNFHFVPVLSAPAGDDDWPGRRGLVHDAMLADLPDMRGYELYACGSLNMIENAVPAFLAHGLDEGACYSDAFLSPHATDPQRPAAG